MPVKIFLDKTPFEDWFVVTTWVGGRRVSAGVVMSLGFLRQHVRAVSVLGRVSFVMRGF